MRLLIAIQILVLFLAGCQPGHPAAAPVENARTGKPVDIAELKRKAGESPQDVKAWISLGNALMDTNQWEDAIEAYRKALALDPKNVNVRVDLGSCYHYANMPENAMREFRTAIAIDPNHKNARRNAGVVLAYDLDKPEEAIKEFEKYLELAPDSPDREAVRKAIEELRAKVQKSNE